MRTNGCFCMIRVMLGFAAMVPVIVYPLMKRITYWPQAFLGTYNMSVFFTQVFEIVCIGVVM